MRHDERRHQGLVHPDAEPVAGEPSAWRDLDEDGVTDLVFGRRMSTSSSASPSTVEVLAELT
jgi:hypothetical protein